MRIPVQYRPFDSENPAQAASFAAAWPSFGEVALLRLVGEPQDRQLDGEFPPGEINDSPRFRQKAGSRARFGKRAWKRWSLALVALGFCVVGILVMPFFA